MCKHAPRLEPCVDESLWQPRANYALIHGRFFTNEPVLHSVQVHWKYLIYDFIWMLISVFLQIWIYGWDAMYDCGCVCKGGTREWLVTFLCCSVEFQAGTLTSLIHSTARCPQMYVTTRYEGNVRPPVTPLHGETLKEIPSKYQLRITFLLK